MALIASVHLNRAIVSLAGNSAVSVIAGTGGSIGGGGSRSNARSLNGEFRSYAQGATRLLTGTTVTRMESLALIALTQSQLNVLYSMMGKTCLFRDSYGRRFYGSFLDLTETTRPLSGQNTAATYLTDAALTITQVTYAEAV